MAEDPPFVKMRVKVSSLDSFSHSVTQSATYCLLHLRSKRSSGQVKASYQLIAKLSKLTQSLSFSKELCENEAVNTTLVLVYFHQ